MILPEPDGPCRLELLQAALDTDAAQVPVDGILECLAHAFERTEPLRAISGSRDEGRSTSMRS